MVTFCFTWAHNRIRIIILFITVANLSPMSDIYCGKYSTERYIAQNAVSTFVGYSLRLNGFVFTNNLDIKASILSSYRNIGTGIIRRRLKCLCLFVSGIWLQFYWTITFYKFNNNSNYNNQIQHWTLYLKIVIQLHVYMIITAK